MMYLKHIEAEFDAWANSYDETTRKAEWGFERYDEILDRIFELTELGLGGCVLDLGTGTGNLAGRFIKKGVLTYGIDLSRQMLQQAQQKHPDLVSICANFCDFSEWHGNYDAVVSSYALHHVPDSDKATVLKALTERLTWEGRIVIADYAFKNDQHRQTVYEDLRRSGREHWIEEIEAEHYAHLDDLSAQVGDSLVAEKIEKWTDFVWVVVMKKTRDQMESNPIKTSMFHRNFLE